MKISKCLLLLSCFCASVVSAEQAALKEAVSTTSKWSGSSWQKWAEQNPSWVEPMEPFRIIANVYYVGTKGIGSYLLTSEQGHVLLDGGMPQNAAQIRDSIQALGFELSDVKYLLNSHAHFDHSGGLHELKALTGARMVASRKDAKWLENGRYPGSDEQAYKSVPVSVDKIIEDGDSIQLGDTRLTAYLTPGHTPGCTSWQLDAVEGGETYRVLMFCSGSVAGNRLVPDPQYSGIVEDYRATFNKISTWDIDVYLSNHPFFFGLKKKRAAQLAGDSLAFVDSEEFSKAVARMAESFELRLKEQTKALELNLGRTQ